MNKNQVLKYYQDEWVPHFDSNKVFDKLYKLYNLDKSKIINYHGNKILIKLNMSPSHIAIHLVPKTNKPNNTNNINNTNIILKDFSLLIWLRGEDDLTKSYLHFENPMGLKKIMNKKYSLNKKNITWDDVYIFLDFMKNQFTYKNTKNIKSKNNKLIQNKYSKLTKKIIS